mmetsp:Transcript_18614/g.33057  ORF Transcript_18614/g.33057 Transcript_18614/m.33057 type:complete len:213 (+) Transcript_18614:530-1168(+)
MAVSWAVSGAQSSCLRRTDRQHPGKPKRDPDVPHDWTKLGTRFGFAPCICPVRSAVPPTPHDLLPGPCNSGSRSACSGGSRNNDSRNEGSRRCRRSEGRSCEGRRSQPSSEEWHQEKPSHGQSCVCCRAQLDRALSDHACIHEHCGPDPGGDNPLPATSVSVSIPVSTRRSPLVRKPDSASAGSGAWGGGCAGGGAREKPGCGRGEGYGAGG